MTSPPDQPRTGLWRNLVGTLELIKFSHSVFALPFALAAMMVAAHGIPSLWTLLCILWCLVAARTAAMAFNRWADWDYDVFNPRTKPAPPSARATARWCSARSRWWPSWSAARRSIRSA
jgi:4-hydroxybenzoate polyprenyltransferase